MVIFSPDDILKKDLYNFRSLGNASIIQFYHRLTGYIIVILLFFLNYFFYDLKIKFHPSIFFNFAI